MEAMDWSSVLQTPEYSTSYTDNKIPAGSLMPILKHTPKRWSYEEVKARVLNTKLVKPYITTKEEAAKPKTDAARAPAKGYFPARVQAEATLSGEDLHPTELIWVWGCRGCRGFGV